MSCDVDWGLELTLGSAVLKEIRSKTLWVKKRMCRTSFIKKLFAITLELLIFFPEHLFTESVIQMANNE